MLGIGIMQELKTAITEATSISIVLPPSASDTDYLAALQLQKVAPEKTYLAAPDEKEAAWRDIFGDPQSKKEFTISINTALAPVDELRYEKSGEALTIYLSHKHPFTKDALSFGEHIPPADLLITVGFRAREEAEHAIEFLPRKGAARHIWLAGMIGEEEQTKLPISSASLLGRLMIRSREDQELDMLWTFITREDFAKTGSGPDEIPKLIKSYARIASIPPKAALFWQYGDSEGTSGILWSDDKAFLQTIAARTGQQAEYSSYIALPTAPHFIDAENATRKLLQGTA